MAFRRDALVEIGGFDPAFQFYLDETDVNMRLARAGYHTALVPLAQVHHGFAASARRRDDRVPTDLYQIGASWGVFQRKHIPSEERAAHWAEQHSAERRRLLGHMVAGRLEPRDVRRLMKGLHAGYAEGQTRAFGGQNLSRHALLPFRPINVQPRSVRYTAVRGLRGGRALDEAAARVADGGIETVFVFSRTALFHSVKFNLNGIWVQRGGLFGRSERGDPMFRLTSVSRRSAREKARVVCVRGE